MNNMNWTNIKGFIFTILFFPCAVFAQESNLQIYQQEFSRADLPAKVKILKEANLDNRVNNSIGQLYEFALQFALQNSEILSDDPDMTELICVAARGAGNAAYRESQDTLWALFSNYGNSLARVEILLAIGKLGKGNIQLIENLNNYLTVQTGLFKSGVNVDYQAISACIASLAELGDSSSYPALFSILSTGFPEVIILEASGTLDLIPGNYKQFIFDVIMKNPPDEKLAAFRAGMNSARFSPSEQGQLAEIALEQSLASAGAEEDFSLSVLRYSAIQALTRLKWTRASALAIRHYYRVQTDYQHGTAPKERFLEAIGCLGEVGSSDAAMVLALQLGLINAQTEKTGVYDREIILSLVKALGMIGSKAAFDYLHYISYLNYPEDIQAAAREALGLLRW